MKVFISGEVGFLSSDASEAFRTIISDMQAKLAKLLERSDYGDAVVSLGVIPTIYPQWMLDQQKAAGREIKERRLLRNRGADYRLFVDHAAFVNGTVDTRRQLLIDNVLAVVRELGVRVKSGFDADRLEADLRNEFDYVR
jgi:hypothetical protein